jgi:hypothetical protein
MKLEVAAVNEVEKVLDDVFDEVARDIKDKYDTVSGESTRLTSSGLLLLETHIGYVKVALESLQQKIGFCSSELHERIEKRESMIKMGMENVADSLIPGFDKLEEKFIELVQSMKSLVGDFEPIASVAVGAETSAADDADAELRARIVAGVASVQKLTVALEQAASMLEGKIEMEEGKWHGRAAKAELSPPDAVGAGEYLCAALAAHVDCRPVWIFWFSLTRFVSVRASRCGRNCCGYQLSTRLRTANACIYVQHRFAVVRACFGSVHTAVNSELLRLISSSVILISS